MERLLNKAPEDGADADVPHEHCITCVRMECKTRPRPPESCDMVSCELHCGAKFHSCKAAEHHMLCPLELVPCLNHNHGCPRVMTRQEMGNHLGVCPASVVQCTMEWNRWPVFSQERQSRVPFAQTNMHARYGQLDVALALRDQRMLNAAMLAPRNTRRALRNPLTLRFPAVPLNNNKISDPPSAFNQSGDTSLTVSDDDSDAPWMKASNPPGLQRSVCNELFRATKRATESLSAALSVVTAPSEGSQENDHAQDLLELNEPSKETGVEFNLDIEENRAGDVCDINIRLPANSGPLKMNIDEARGFAYSVDHDKINIENAREKLSIQLSPRSPHGPVNATWQNSDMTMMMESTDTNPERGSSIPVPPAPYPMFKLSGILGLDLNLESITRYQAKPKSMYTFLCAQDFRRDEYTWHFKNIHSDIHGGLNGWLEQRCPLAHYGCTFSVRRLHPCCAGSKVVYSQLLESFGVTPHVPDDLLHNAEERNCMDYVQNESDIKNTNSGKEIDLIKETTPEIFTSKDYDSAVHINGKLPTHSTNGQAHPISKDNDHGDSNSSYEPTSPSSPSSESICGIAACDSLSQLPFEVLRYIARFLDGFSLCNLALTSHRLREVCLSMLEEKGMVVEEWERRRRGDRWSWHVSHRCWKFSTAFSPVHSWGHEENGRMSEHLKNCPYFSRSEPKSPLKPLNLPSMECRYHHSPQFWKTMHRMYPDFSPEPPVKVNHMKKSCSTDGCLASALDDPGDLGIQEDNSLDQNGEILPSVNLDEPLDSDVMLDTYLSDDTLSDSS